MWQLGELGLKDALRALSTGSHEVHVMTVYNVTLQSNSEFIEPLLKRDPANMEYDPA